MSPKFDEHVLESKKYLEYRQTEEENLIKALSRQHGLPYVNLHGISINPEALVLIGEKEAYRANIVAFEKQNRLVSVAIQNPNDPATQQVIEQLKGSWQLSLYMCSKGSLEHAWTRYADQRAAVAVKKGVLDIDSDEIIRMATTLRTGDGVRKKVEEVRTLNPARRVSAMLEVLFAGGLALDASDIHIEPEAANVRVRYRIDGVLQDIISLPKEDYFRAASRLKLLAGLLINKRNEAQDGRFTFDSGEKKIEVRTSVIPGSAGESIVMRLLDPTVASFDMEKLGLNPIMHRVMEEELKRPNGMIITTGPTGSGKTTALYAFLRAVHNPEVKIITIEDPVEYKVDGIVQTQVEEGYTFAQGLRSILRQDPDIIMVGEIRDREVAETAVHAAETGHLVFSTLHTNNAPGAFPRLIDLGVDSRLIGSSTNIVLGQRLVRKLCEQCKVARTASAEEKAKIVRVISGHPLAPDLSGDLQIFDAKGCPECGHTGYKGRQGVFEAIKVDEAVEEAVIRDPREHVILEAATPQGIPTMAEDGMDKVLQGVTSLAELERVVDLTLVRKSPSSAAIHDTAQE